MTSRSTEGVTGLARETALSLGHLVGLHVKVARLELADGETDDAVEPAPPGALREPMSHARRRVASATTRRPASAAPPSVDEHATMPATEPSN
jgi:hypothetical protein